MALEENALSALIAGSPIAAALYMAARLLCKSVAAGWHAHVAPIIEKYFATRAAGLAVAGEDVAARRQLADAGNNLARAMQARADKERSEHGKPKAVPA